jgi:chromosome segregation ATPase
VPFIPALTTDNAQLTTIDTEVNQQMMALSNKVTTTTTPLVTDECDVHQESMNETIEVFNGGIKVLHDELQQISDDSLQQSQIVETTDQTLTTLKTSYEESSAGLNALNTNLSILQQDCASLRQTIEESQYTSYDGTLMWKITNVQEKMGNHF